MKFSILNFHSPRMAPFVASVDLMSTGVDIPDLEFIVFLRPVKSRILFEQMLGRGEPARPPCPNRSPTS
ncbi:MAG TPA: helicase-related protein [Pirellulales bacterium]